MSEYLSKEEIKRWRSSVEKITLEEYAARLGKKLQEEKQTNDLADMLYTRFNPAQSPANYDTVTKLEKIDLSPKPSSPKALNVSKNVDDFDVDMGFDDDFEDNDIEITKQPVIKEEKAPKIVKKETEKEQVKKIKKETVETKEIVKNPEKKSVIDKNKKESAPKKEKEKAKPKTETISSTFAGLNVTFQKPLTDREEKVLSYFVEKRGEIVYAKDLAELLDLKRDYIYKYIKNLRAKMSTDLIANADNGGFKLD